jgi:MFS family permease
VTKCRYDVGVLASVLVHPGFVAQLDKPDASRTGVITAIYYLGTWSSYIFFSRPLNDLLGRRYASLVGMLTTSLGTAIQASSSGSPTSAYAMMIAGRVLSGLGNAVISTGVPLYQR